MKFSHRQFRAFKALMTPKTPTETEEAAVFAELFAEFVACHYMSDKFEFVGFEGGEAVFTDDRGDVITASDLWMNCKFVEDLNSGAIDDPDDPFEPSFDDDGWLDEEIII